MVIVLVLFTFICFVAVDYFLHSRPQKSLEMAAPPPEPKQQFLPVNVVGGFKLAPGASYHAGHTWAAKETQNIVRVGLDDFAVRLLGNFDHLDLPARGRWMRQGERAGPWDAATIGSKCSRRSRAKWLT